MVGAACPRCRGVVALHEGHPVVTFNGSIELWHHSCWSVRHAPRVTDPRARLAHGRGVEEVTVIAPPARKHPHPAIAAGVAIGAFALGLAQYSMRGKLPTASLAVINFDTDESVALGATLAEHEPPPPAFDPRDAYPVPVVDDMPLDEMYPSLLDWIHPVVDTDAILPEQASGRFGAEREGVERAECGRGHCGVDLGGPIGRPIVAVADGVVMRVEHAELGRDGRSGRYVRIEHADGSLTSYMHLDTITQDLEVGDRVDGGQQIGTLGATAVYSAAPHCHFALELPNVPGTHAGDAASTHYVDPAPFLIRASVARAPDRRHSMKPAL